MGGIPALTVALGLLAVLSLPQYSVGSDRDSYCEPMSLVSFR